VSSELDDDATYRTDLDGFKHIELRPRRLVDISRTNSRTEVFGATFEAPIFR
jgi:isopentenyl diphosphate isomerase/L-lactate dehydrogenase-like FMN-dependent dehydrogenase